MSPPVLPDSSPFSSEQRNWLNGYLAGLNQIQSADNSIQTVHVPAIPVLVLFGSQSGTAEGLAQALTEKLAAVSSAAGAACVPGNNSNGFKFNPRLLGMDHFRDYNWATEKCILLLTSTWGEGDMPDNAVAFWEWLKSPEAPVLSQTHFAVLGLGDRNYAHFCQACVQVFTRLTKMRVIPIA